MIRGKLILRPGKSPLVLIRQIYNGNIVSGSGTEADREADPLTDSEAVKFARGKQPPILKQGFQIASPLFIS